VPKLEILVGMIGSGKSTYARWRADRGAIVICHDDLTQALHGGRYRYEADLKPLYRGMTYSLASLALARGRDAVIDRTHLTLEARSLWTAGKTTLGLICAHARPDDLLPGGGPGPLELVAVRFPAGPAAEHARRRFESDDRGRPYLEWLAVAELHAAQAAAEPLDWAAEGFDGLELVGAPLLLEMARENSAARPPAYLPPRERKGVSP
jgi:hypothetical protein